MMEPLKCAQCGDRPGLLVTVADRAAGTSINLCHECYKKYARHVKNGKAVERVTIVFEEGVSRR
jgi:ribosome-binding protein aMBF1 (putative translation factor)